MQTLIIAEAGVNHNGSVKLAKKLAKAAKECGADIVKFQTADLSSLVSVYAPLAGYQKETANGYQSQKQMLKKLLLAEEDFLMLADYCKQIGIQFLSTPFDVRSIKALMPLQDIWKIPSGEVTDYQYLVEIAKTGKDIIMSTGMCTLDEVDAALRVLKGHRAGHVTLLHCTTEYPAPMQEVNLKAMWTLKNYFQCPVGYSDHTRGIEVAVAAVAMGACVVEKHLTLDRGMEGPDHKASLEPGEFAGMVGAIRNIGLAMGNGIKSVSPSEEKNKIAARKSLVAARFIKKGEPFTERNIAAKRPGSGISPMRLHEMLGQAASRDFQEDELIEL